MKTLAAIADGTSRRAGIAVYALAALSFLGCAAFFAYKHGYMWNMIDLDTYYQAIKGLPGNQHSLYTGLYGLFPDPFLYPPFSAALMRPMTLVSEPTTKWITAAFCVSALLVAIRCAWHLEGRRGASARRLTALVFAGAVWLEPVVHTVLFGQVSLILLAVLLADACLDGRRGQGVLTGLATGFKLFPGVFILYFLLTRRYRAAATSAATFAATVVIGWALYPTASVQFWFHAIGGSNRINRYVTVGDATNQSIKALLYRMGPHSALVTPLWLLGAGTILVLGLYAARVRFLRGDRTAGFLLTGAACLLASPISWTHAWVLVVVPLLCPMLRPLLAAEAEARAVLRARLLLAGLFLVALAYPMRLTFNGRWSHAMPYELYGLVWLAPHASGQEFDWSVVDGIIGNAYVFCGSAAICVLAAPALLAAYRRRRPARVSALIEAAPASEEADVPIG
jgi:alpha-1,2-mannosyltransferase